MQEYKYKNTNKYCASTQVQQLTKCQKDPTCGIFLERGLLKDIENDILIGPTRKYKNTNIQIHKYSK